MKLLLYTFFLFFLFTPFKNIQAQCPAACTITISTANGNLNQSFNTSAGDVVCLIDGTYTGSINVNGASTICVSSGATYSGGGNQNATTTIINRGNWTSSLNLNNGSSFLNTGTGTVNMAGALTICSTCSFISNNSSTVNISGAITNSGTIQINGTANISGGVTNNSNSTIIFNGQANISGNVVNNSNATLNFNANASISGSLTNNSNGTINATNASITVTGNLINNGQLQAGGSCGRFNVNGSTTNNSSGQVGTNGTQLDICDPSAPRTPPNRGFDNQNANAGNFGSNLSYCTCVPTLLPITLSSFTAKKEDNNRVYIDWKTVWELDNDYFQVERSYSGTDFNVIAQISAQSQMNEPYKERNYSFIDNLTDNMNAMPSKETIYYRLKQIDTNGDFSYSPVVSVQIEKQNKEEIKGIFLENEWKFELHNEIQVKIYSSIGVLKGIYYLNQNQNTISVSHFSKGIYILHSQDIKTNKTTILKVIK